MGNSESQRQKKAEAYGRAGYYGPLPYVRPINSNERKIGEVPSADLVQTEVLEPWASVFLSEREAEDHRLAYNASDARGDAIEGLDDEHLSWITSRRTEVRENKRTFSFYLVLYCDTMEHTRLLRERLSVMGLRQTKSGVAILVMDQAKKKKQQGQTALRPAG